MAALQRQKEKTKQIFKYCVKWMSQKKSETNEIKNTKNKRNKCEKHTQTQTRTHDKTNEKIYERKKKTVVYTSIFMNCDFYR